MAAKVDDIGYPILFFAIKNLMAISHVKGFSLTMLTSYITFDIPVIHFFVM